MLSGGVDYLSSRQAVGPLSAYLGQHNFPPCHSSLSASIFSFLHLLLFGDGSADRRGFQRQWLWPQWVFSQFISRCLSWYSGYVMVKFCFWSLRLVCQSISALAVKDILCLLSCSVGFFAETARKGTVVSRANSIGSTSASSVPNTGIVVSNRWDLTLLTRLKREFMLF